MKNNTVREQAIINAPVAEVWNALTDPDVVKQYFFNTNVDSDWKKGAPITYWGIWEGKEYRDKGTILDIEEEKILRHTHWSSLSGSPDTPENYYTVTYELQPQGDDQTQLTITQEGNMTDKSAEHSAKNWQGVLAKLKELLETHPSLNLDIR